MNGEQRAGALLQNEAMRRSAADTQRQILQAAYELFYRKGYGRVGVDEIAARAHLTKRTLYYHFKSKDELLGRVLEGQHELALQRIQGWLNRLPDDVGAMLGSLFSDLASWAAKPRWESAGFTRLVMELADLPGHPARAIARQHKAAVEGCLADALACRHVPNAEMRAKQVMLLIEGCLSLLLIHGDKTYADCAADAARRTLRD